MPVFTKDTSEKKEPTVRLELVYDDGIVTVQDADEDWSVISFKFVGGKLKFFRHSSIDDTRYALDSDGNIEETPE